MKTSFSNRPRMPRVVGFVILILLGLLAGSSVMLAQKDRVRRERVTSDTTWIALAILPMNSDLYPDTLLAARVAEGKGKPIVYPPEWIAWGRPRNAKDDSVRGGKFFKGDYEDSKRTFYTKLDMPALENLAIDVIPSYLDEDSLRDIVFSVKGQIREKKALIDTSYMIVLFGTDGIDTLNKIALDPKSKAFGRDIVTEKVAREDIATGVHKATFDPGISYEVKRSKSKSLVQQDPETTAAVSPRESNSFRVFPNPGSGALTLVLSEQAMGIVRLVVTNAEGALQREVRFDETGTNRFSVDLTDLSTGAYSLEVFDDLRLVGRTTIVLIR